ARIRLVHHHAHEAGVGLSDRVVRRLVAVWAVLSETRDGAVHQARIERIQSVVVDAEALHHPGTVVLQHHVDLARGAAEQLLSLELAQIEREAQLVAIEGAELMTVAVRFLPGDAKLAERIADPGTLDLDHLRAQVGEQQARIRARDELAELEDLDAFERTRHAMPS